jgi:CRP-like cAMP-binding protein
MPGDFFGGRAPLPDLGAGRRNATVIAETPAEVWRMARPALERQLSRNPNLLLHLRTLERVRLGIAHK